MHVRWILGVAAVVVLAWVVSRPLAAAPAPESAEPSVARPADLDDQPVPVPEPSEQALRYYRSGNVLWALWQVWELCIPALLLFTGLSAVLRKQAFRVGKPWYFAFVLYLILYGVLTFLLELPLAYYSGYVRQHAYGLSNQTLAKWFYDRVLGLAIGVVGSAAFLWIPYRLVARSPRRWWLYTGLLAIPFAFFVALIEPIWVEPLFNKFGPMHDKALESQILALADRAGIEGSRVFEVDKSADTNALNAYVTGFWNTKRIVLWDTLLAKLDDDEVLSVMAHEMGHYVLKHVIQGILFTSALVLFGLYCVQRLADVLLRRYHQRFGFDRLSDFASLPLAILLINLVTFFLTPLGLAFSRHIEHEADRFGVELTHANHAAATAFVKLQQENLSNPRPGLLYRLWRGSHPSIAERIEFLNTYRPWEHGQPSRYGALFHKPPETPAAAGGALEP
jgi:Zn-dependent protease with chaperone function